MLPVWSVMAQWERASKRERERQGERERDETKLANSLLSAGKLLP
jgi:hypothetical protein